MADPKPEYHCDLELIRQNFPPELIGTTAWCLWRYQWREPKNGKAGKWTKVPYQPNGAPAKSNTRSTWSSFEVVSARYKHANNKFDGVGFFLFPPLVGVDLDRVRNPKTGVIEQWAQNIINELDSYSEVSPSGTGVHVWTTGELSPDARNRVGQIEVYQLGRYFTVSGGKI